MGSLIFLVDRIVPGVISAFYRNKYQAFLVGA
jgi:hypothetical protein